jgi:tetratricopeptide (TPR) repeat protein
MKRVYLLSMALMLTPPLAQAQRGAKSQAALVKEGERLYNARRYREAAETLKKAYEAAPDARILYNIARAYEQVGDLRESMASYNQFISTSGGDTDPLLVKRAHSAVERLRLLIDKEEQQQAAVETERKRLQDEAEAARKQAEAEQEAARRAQETAQRQQQAEYQRAQAAYQRDRIAAFALGGVAVASVGTGVLFGLQARSARKDFDEATQLADKESAADSTRSKALVADIGFGVGLAAAIGAIILYPKEGPPARGEVRMTAAPRGLGAGMEVSF